MTISCVCIFIIGVLLLVEKSKPLSQHMFEARGPGGCLLLIEILTDSNSRSHQEIKRLLIKNGSVHAGHTTDVSSLSSHTLSLPKCLYWSDRFMSKKIFMKFSK